METHHHHHHHGNADCIRIVPIFNHLDQEQMRIIAETAQTKKIAKNELLFMPGQKDDTLYIINSGKIRIYHLNESGREQTIRILNPGDFTGEAAIFQEGSMHTNYGEATLDTTLCLIKQADLNQHLENYPAITKRILADVTSRLQKSERQTSQVGIENVTARLVAFLTENVEKDSDIVTLPMTKRELASYLGTTPETLSRKFTALEEQGLIAQLPKRQIRILDLEALIFEDGR